MNKLIVASAIIFICTFQISCKNKKQENQNASIFTLSDTMMKHCLISDVTKEPLKNEIRLFGKIVADNNKQAQVYPIVGGSVLKINVELGDFVQQGQVLATVKSGEVAEFHKELLDAQSDLALAEKNLKVARELYEGKLSSEREVLAAQKEKEKAVSALNRINEIYNIYKLGNGSVYNIVAPISGFIVKKDINKNEQLRSDKSDVVFSIAQIDDVWVLANVNESDISRVKEGYEADIQTVSYPDRIYKGKVDKIFNAIDPETKAMKVRVKIANNDLSLKPDMNAIVTLRFQENEQFIAVPSSAIIFDKSKNWVMVFKDRNNIETRQVEVLRQVGNTSYISSGLSIGEKIIEKNGLYIYDALND